jgi:diguanylate cyclase (GGDEF)-like protein
MVPGYDLLAMLGRGARSAVYRARRDADRLEYALKILDQAKLDTSADLVSFRREAALLASIDHIGLARIHEVGAAEGRPYLVMDLIRGRSLGDVLADGPMPTERVIRLGLDIVAPLSAVHARGLVHRDLKPANIMMLPDGSARLIDFGLSGHGQSGAQEPAPAVAGTLAYAPPEQSGTLIRPVDSRSDLYALGVVLFQGLSGRLPFEAADVGELLRLHATAPAPDLRRLVPGIPPGLADLVATLLKKDPDDRYQFGEHVAAHLRALAADPRFRPGAAGPPPPPDRGLPIVGRRVELARLKERWELARRGQGGIVLVRGAAGVGKSRLLDEFVAQVRAEGRVALSGRCAPDDLVPLAPVRAAVNAHLDAVLSLPADRRAGEMAIITAAAGRGARTALAALSPRLARALGVDPASGPGTGPDDDRFTETVIDFLARMATARGELLLVLDDLQWADSATVLLLRRLAEELSAVPLLVVVGARGDDVDREQVQHPVRVTDLMLDLGPLTDDEVRGQVENLVPGLGRIPHLAQLLAVRSNGNPFIVLEYVRAVIDAGLLRPSWGSWILDVEKLGGLDLPQDAVGLVLTRVNGLRPPVRELLTTAAAVGRRFRVEVVAAVVGRDAESVLADLGDAAHRRLLESLSGGEFGFVHTRIREALLDDLAPADRADLHGRIAEALDTRAARSGWSTEHTFALAHHHLAARGGRLAVSTDRALAACQAAGRLALEHHSADEAVSFLDYAVELAGERATGELWLLLGTALQRAGRMPEALSWLRRALAAEADPVGRAEILARIAELHQAQWDAVGATTAIDHGLAELGAPVPRGRVAAALTTFAFFVLAQLSRVTGVGFGRAEGEDRRRWQVISRLNNVGVYVGVIDVRPAQILKHAARLVWAAARLGSGPEFLVAQGQIGMIYALTGWRRAAGRAFDRARADPAYQEPALAAAVEYQFGAAAYLAGWDNGEQLTRIAEEHGRWMEFGAYLDSIGLLHVEATTRGRSADAEFWLERGLARMESRDGLRAFSTAAAVSHALRGDAAAAGQDLSRLAEQFNGSQARALALVRLQATLVVLNEQAELGEPFEAAVAELERLGVDPVKAVRPNHGIPLQIAVARLAQLRWADPARRPDRLAAAQAAVARLPRSGPSDVLRARAVLARAHLLVLEGRPQEALPVLDAVPSHFEPDAPLVALEVRLVRARALAAVGAVEEARRAAHAALAVAREEGWPHRARAIVSEFGIPAAEPGTHSMPSSGTGNSLRAGSERRRLQALEQVSSAASRVIDPRELARIILDETLGILHAERAFLFLLEGDRLSAYLGRDADGDDVSELTGYSTTLVDRVRDTARPLVVTGTEEGAALGAQSVVLHGLRSIMAAPVLLEGRLLGVVYLDSQVARGIFTPDDVSLLSALTHHIATSLETARAAQLEIDVRSVQRQRDVAETLRRAQDELSATLDPDEVIRRLLVAAERITHCDRACIVGIRSGSADLLTLGDDGKPVHRSLALDPDLHRLAGLPEPAAGAAADLPAEVSAELTAEAAGPGSWLAIPLRTDQSGIGVLLLAATRPGADLTPELEVAAALGSQAATAYDRARLFSTVQELAVVDDVTGIANRRRFFEVAARDLASARRHGRDVTALMIDIDHFSRVNDTFGRLTGDEVIREVAQRLVRTIRVTDLAARYGGEAFALLLPEAGADNTLPERLRAAVADEPVTTRSGPVRVTISVGQAVLQPTDTTVDALLARADEALSAAKRQGRNRVCIAPG